MRPMLLVAACVAVLPAACTFVHMAPSAKQVRVLTSAPGCEKRGEVSVSVKDSVAFYERNNLRVREELETLARNEAPGLDADTIQPLAPPLDGEQRFAAYHCGGASAGVSGPAPGPAGGMAQTYPIGG